LAALNETNLAQFNTQFISLNANAGGPKNRNYASVDFDTLVGKFQRGARSLFVEIKAWD